MLDSERRELRDGSRPIHLPQKSFRLLELLVREAPRAVPREELYAALWGETNVEEANLSNMVSDLRAALGDSRSEPRYVKTVHGFGYAFIFPPTQTMKGDRLVRLLVGDNELRLVCCLPGRDS